MTSWSLPDAGAPVSQLAGNHLQPRMPHLAQEMPLERRPWLSKPPANPTTRDFERSNPLLQAHVATGIDGAPGRVLASSVALSLREHR